MLIGGWFLVAACQSSPTTAGAAAHAPGGAGGASSAPWSECQRLFGFPSPRTGLTADQCGPVCSSCALGAAGATGFTATTFDTADLDALRAHVLDDPPAMLDQDPYSLATPPEEHSSEFCGMIPSTDGHYRLETFETAEQLLAEGAQLTHEGACGACSSLQDLAVYVEYPDLTDPVRACALESLGEPLETLAACLGDLGFTEPCAEIWAYNSRHTSEVCLEVCLGALDEPYHLPDGSPNECIQCDEDQSGPVFKAVAGRTRRNSGLPTALCRPCTDVVHIDHSYP